jgi:threonine dehydratase
MSAHHTCREWQNGSMPPVAASFAQDAAHVRELIRPYVRVTPTLRTSGDEIGCAAFPLTLKLELFQHSGSFKARGAFANLLTRQVPAAGVVAASGGNHGAAVSYAARRLGIPAHIFVPTVCSPAKVQRIRDYGATITITGERYADSLDASEAWAASHGALTIHAFEQMETLLGQATLGIEVANQVPDAATVLVSIGGGGLIGGIAAWYQRRVKIIGVEPVAAPTMMDAFRAGRPVDAPAGGVAVDSLAPKRVGDLTYAIAKEHVDRIVLVEDEDIIAAQQALWNTYRIAAEPGGAAALAAILSGRYQPALDEHVVVIVCGGNVAR